MSLQSNNRHTISFQMMEEKCDLAKPKIIMLEHETSCYIRRAKTEVVLNFARDGSLLILKPSTLSAN